jgi:ABC-type molybdate transport system ATPase subunit
MLQLDEKSLNELNNFLQEMPTKYGLPIINFLNAKIQEQSKKGADTVVVKEEGSVTSV